MLQDFCDKHFKSENKKGEALLQASGSGSQIRGTSVWSSAQEVSNSLPSFITLAQA
jgi:hypothetical protein